MKPIVRRLVRFIALVMGFPLVHLTVSGADTWLRGYAFAELLPRYLLELLIFATLPHALFNGRVPLTTEISSWGTGEKLLAIFSLSIVWIAVSSLVLNTGAWLIRQVRLQPRLLLAGILPIVLFALVGIILGAQNAPSSQVSARVDGSRSLGQMPDHARGFAQGGEGQMTQVSYFEQTIPHLRALNTTLVRIDHLFDYYDVLQLAEDGTPIYRWDDLDRIVDTIFAAGAQPYMSLSYAPPLLAGETVYGPLADLTAWSELVYQTVTYYNIERGLNIRYWEVWNEPNLPGFWSGTLEEYLQLYAVTAQAIHRADPNARVGGAATIPHLAQPWPYAFIPSREWVVSLTEYAQAEALPLDFVSWHVYGTDPALFTRSVELHEEWTRAYTPAPELIISEWNWSPGSDARMDTGETAAYAAAVVRALSDTSLEHALFFEPIDGHADWRGFWGLIRADGQIKPIYNAFRLISTLQGERLYAESDHPEAGIMASRTEDDAAGRVQVLVWYNGNEHPTVTITLTLEHLGIECPASVTVQGVDSEHGNTYANNQADDLFVQTLPAERTLSSDCLLSVTVPQHGIRLISVTSPSG